MPTPIAYPVIDCHVHLFPDKLFERIWDYFIRYDWTIRYRLRSPEAIRFLLDHGIERFWFSNYAHKPGVARPLIDYSLDLLDRHPEARYFAAVHPGDPDVLDYVETALAHPRVLGFKLQLLVQRFHADDPRLHPIYERVREAGKAILFHAGTGPVANEFVGITHFRRLLSLFPDLRCQVAHLGAFEHEEFFALAGDYPGLFFDTSFTFARFPGLSRFSPRPSVDALRLLADRIVYGSDFPNLPFDHSEEIVNLRSIGLGDSLECKIFRENALRIEQELLGASPPRRA